MENQKGPCKDCSPSTRGLYGFPWRLPGGYLRVRRGVSRYGAAGLSEVG